MQTTLMHIARSERAQVRSGIKTLLSTRPHPASARLTGAGFLPAAALMRVDQHAAVCPGRGVGGRFVHEGSVFFLSDEGITNGNELFVSVRHVSKTGGVL